MNNSAILDRICLKVMMLVLWIVFQFPNAQLKGRPGVHTWGKKAAIPMKKWSVNEGRGWRTCTDHYGASTNVILTSVSNMSPRSWPYAPSTFRQDSCMNNTNIPQLTWSLSKLESAANRTTATTMGQTHSSAWVCYQRKALIEENCQCACPPVFIPRGCC